MCERALDSVFYSVVVLGLGDESLSVAGFLGNISTVWGEGVDSLLFFPLAFYGVLPDYELPLMIISQLVLKTVYDHGVSYNIFAVFKR